MRRQIFLNIGAVLIVVPVLIGVGVYMYTAGIAQGLAVYFLLIGALLRQVLLGTWRRFRQ